MVRHAMWVLGGMVIGACGGSVDNTPPVVDVDTKTVFQKLGGEDGLRPVVATFVDNVARDADINFMFASTDLDRLEGLLYDQVCEAAGGPCTYTGGDMVTVHADLAITEQMFFAMMNDFMMALDEHEVPYSVEVDGTKPADFVVGALMGMRSQIVTQPDAVEAPADSGQ